MQFRPLGGAAKGRRDCDAQSAPVRLQPRWAWKNRWAVPGASSIKAELETMVQCDAMRCGTTVRGDVAVRSTSTKPRDLAFDSDPAAHLAHPRDPRCAVVPPTAHVPTLPASLDLDADTDDDDQPAAAHALPPVFTCLRRISSRLRPRTAALSPALSSFDILSHTNDHRYRFKFHHMIRCVSNRKKKLAIANAS